MPKGGEGQRRRQILLEQIRFVPKHPMTYDYHFLTLYWVQLQQAHQLLPLVSGEGKGLLHETLRHFLRIKLR